jgi:hypothetical protein
MSPSTGTERGALVGIPAAALTALPACPACYPLYAGILSSLGLSALIDPGAQAVLTSLLLAVALAALAFRARRRRGYGPLALGVAASSVVLAAKFGLGWSALTYAGVALLLAAGLWNAWPRSAGGVACSSCAREGVGSAR